MKRHCCFAILIAGVSTLTPLLGNGQPTQKESTNVWAKAEVAIEEHLKQVDPKIRYAEFRSDMLRKYLPDFRVFVRSDRNMAGESRLFVINQEAQVTNLGEGVWKGDPTAKCWRVKQVAEFLRAQKIRVQTGEDAIEIAKLFEDLAGAPDYIGFVRINTKDFTLFDKRFMERQLGPKTDWRYTGMERKNGWIVKVEYVGPPSMVRQPPTYEMDINEDSRLFDLRRFPYFE